MGDAVLYLGLDGSEVIWRKSVRAPGPPGLFGGVNATRTDERDQDGTKIRRRLGGLLLMLFVIGADFPDRCCRETV